MATIHTCMLYCIGVRHVVLGSKNRERQRYSIIDHDSIESARNLAHECLARRGRLKICTYDIFTYYEVSFEPCTCEIERRIICMDASKIVHQSTACVRSCHAVGPPPLPIQDRSARRKFSCIFTRRYYYKCVLQQQANKSIADLFRKSVRIAYALRLWELSRTRYIEYTHSRAVKGSIERGEREIGPGTTTTTTTILYIVAARLHASLAREQ
ncbi:unnamed protein product [Trichogramma brassicae]|uniref:Uncharacterized protein n=1 Tax=Trichogramma brassicae TaxID=86971 RepID=A0A6H5INS9_9HYME|nr:unnamed protein product [Trichogramma brassicae]